MWQMGFVLLWLAALAARRPWERGRPVSAEPYRTDTGRYHFWVFLPLGIIPVAGAMAPLMPLGAPWEAMALGAAPVRLILFLERKSIKKNFIAPPTLHLHTCCAR